MPVAGRFARFFALTLPAALLAVPAQAESDSDLAPLIETLADPARQQALAQTLAVLSEAFLDLPLAPMARAAAQAAGENPDTIDPDMTLRQIAPDAERVPEELSARVPEMMGAMAGMAQGMEDMLPALRQMAERMEQSLPDRRD